MNKKLLMLAVSSGMLFASSGLSAADPILFNVTSDVFITLDPGASAPGTVQCPVNTQAVNCGYNINQFTSGVANLAALGDGNVTIVKAVITGNNGKTCKYEVKGSSNMLGSVSGNVQMYATCAPIEAP